MTYEEKINNLVRILKSWEYQLSDGYEWYCPRREAGVDETLRKIAVEIYKAMVENEEKMSTQPMPEPIDINKVRDGKILFSDLPVGAVVTYKNERTVRIAKMYFNIRPFKNGTQNRMVNAMIEETGELLYVPEGLVFKI